MLLFHRKAKESGPWCRLDLSASEVSEGEADILEGVFRQIYIASNAPEGMALLMSPSTDSGGRSFFFTPSSFAYVQSLIRIYSAVPAEPPSLLQLTVRVGVPSKTYSDARAF